MNPILLLVAFIFFIVILFCLYKLFESKIKENIKKLITVKQTNKNIKKEKTSDLFIQLFENINFSRFFRKLSKLIIPVILFIIAFYIFNNLILQISEQSSSIINTTGRDTILVGFNTIQLTNNVLFWFLLIVPMFL